MEPLHEEVARFDSILRETQRVSLGSQALGSLLNLGQVLIFSSGLLASAETRSEISFQRPFIQRRRRRRRQRFTCCNWPNR